MGFEVIVPQVAFAKFKRKLNTHITFHYFLHNTLCRLMSLRNYKKVPYWLFVKMVKKEPGDNGGPTRQGMV